MRLLSATLVFAAFNGLLCDNLPDLNRFRVRVVTWNVNSNQLPTDFSDLLGVAKMSKDPGADMIVVGLQNLGVLANENDNDWIKALKAHVHDGYYFPIEASIRKGNGFVVFGRTGTYSKHVEKTSVKSRGVNLKIFSKVGAIITNFNYFQRQFTFVGLHLDKQVDEAKRLKQYAEVKKDIKENYDPQSDFVFWLGNLNFKIDLEPSKAKPYIDKKDWTTLLTHDQLKKAQKNKQGFEDLKEQDINFRPTYKFKPSTDDYNWEETPSWTDRILFGSKKDKTITPVKYESIEKYKESDHKPVVGEFTLKLN